MLPYSRKLKMHLAEPSVAQNNRTEFKVTPDLLLTSNLRWVGFGMVSAAGTADKVYAAVGGIYTAIKNIYLYEGAEVLSQLRQSAEMLAVKNLLKSNEYNSSMKLISGTRMGFEKKAGLVNQIDQIPRLTDSAATTFKGYLDLRESFGFLKAQDYVDTMKFKNLRLVIEWRTDYPNLVDGDATGFVASPLHGRLMFDEIVDTKLVDQIRSKTSPVVYSDWEYERFMWTNSGSLQTFNSNAFKNKFLYDLVLLDFDPVQLADQVATNFIKLEGSSGQPAEVIQLRLNGKNVFDMVGINSPARKLCLMTDTLGNLNIPIFGNTISDKATAANSGVADLAQRLNYGGFTVDSPVNEMAFQVQRANTAGTSGANNIELHVHGRVRKQLEQVGSVWKVRHV